MGLLRFRGARGATETNKSCIKHDRMPPAQAARPPRAFERSEPGIVTSVTGITALSSPGAPASGTGGCAGSGAQAAAASLADFRTRCDRGT